MESYHLEESLQVGLLQPKVRSYRPSLAWQWVKEHRKFYMHIGLAFLHASFFRPGSDHEVKGPAKREAPFKP